MDTLKISNLFVEIDKKTILKGINLEVKTGEIHAIMGPNGNGKSTLAYSLMGNPNYSVTKGSALLNNKELLEMEVNERAKAGLFLAMQYPIEVTGVTNAEFMKEALNAHLEKPVKVFDFIKEYEKNLEILKIDASMAHRYLNEGFSGGERKRNEILQLLTLKPKFAILDEIDSGLDIDALKIVSSAINGIESSTFGCIIITHYQRILEYIKPTHVHILIDGRIVKTGGFELIKKIEQDGYEWIKDKVGNA